jgi:hypothetical protein
MMKWTKDVTYLGEKSDSYEDLTGIPEGKRPL